MVLKVRFPAAVVQGEKGKRSDLETKKGGTSRWLESDISLLVIVKRFHTHVECNSK